MFPIESREVYPDTTENFIVCIKCGHLTDTKYKHECPEYKLVFNSPITSAFAWGLDFWTAFKLRPKVVRWLVRLLIGKMELKKIPFDKNLVYRRSNGAK